MKSKIIAILTLFAVPLLYYYCDETATILLTALAGSGLAIYSLLEQTKISLKPTKLLYAMLVCIFLWFLTVGNSVFNSVSLYASIPALIKLCLLLLITYSVCQELSINKDNFICFYRIGALAGYLQGCITIIEYIQAPPIPPTWLDPASKELFRTRCCGIMTDPNINAAFLSVLFILTIALIIKSDIKFERICASLSLIFCGTGIMTTLSRGGWIALFAALVALAISMYIAKYKLQTFHIRLLSITAVILLVIFFAGPFKYRLFSITKPSDMTFYQRTLINRGIFGSINKLPFWGHGLSTFWQVYPYYRIVGGDYPFYAHNEYLQSMIETGFISTFLLIILTLGLMYITYISAKQNKFDNLVFSSIFISLLIQNLSGFSSRIFPTSVLIAISVGGILASQLNINNSKNLKNNNKKLLNAIILVFVVFVLIGSYHQFTIQKELNQANKLISETKNLSEAEKILEKIIEQQPNNSSAANILGMLQLLTKRPEKAAETWAKALEHNKFEAVFPINLARLYSDSDANKADFYYKKVLELDSASENFRLEYSKFLIKQNRKSEAKEILEKGLTYSPGFHNVYTGFQEMENLIKSLQ